MSNEESRDELFTSGKATIRAFVIPPNSNTFPD